MSRLALGTVQFGIPYGIANKAGQVTRASVKNMLQLAAANSIDTLDTAMAYGESENCLGEIGVKEFRVVTKLPAISDASIDISAWSQRQLNEALARLDETSVYGLLLHSTSQLKGKNGEALYKALQDLKASGQVQKIGISIYSPNELDELFSYYDFDLVQAPFNLLDRRLAESGWLERLKEKDVEIHVRSVFLQGLLLMEKENIPVKFTPWNELFIQWHKWLSNNSVSAIQACLAYPLSFSEIDRVIVGCDSMTQLEQIINMSQTHVSCELPDLGCDDEKLINPSFWSQL
jgi:aryl-alcohol dehydrogenase-like predicted oxidoreductase